MEGFWRGSEAPLIDSAVPLTNPLLRSCRSFVANQIVDSFELLKHFGPGNLRVGPPGRTPEATAKFGAD